MRPVPVTPFSSPLPPHCRGQLRSLRERGEVGGSILVVLALAVVAMLFAWMTPAEKAWVGAALGLVADWHWPNFNPAGVTTVCGIGLPR